MIVYDTSSISSPNITSCVFSHVRKWYSEFLSHEEKLKFEDEELKMQKIRDKYSNTIQISQFIPLGVQLKKVMSDEAKAEYSQSETRKEEIIREYISKQIYKCVSAYIEVEKTKIVKID